MLALGVDLLRRLAPPPASRQAERQHEIIEGMGVALTNTLEKFEIDTVLRIAHFLAQVAHESDGFCTTEEYASGLAYEGRVDLGNTQKGDGPLYKGRGLIQLTGRANYQSMSEKLGVDLIGKPLTVNDPAYYLLVSCQYWQDRRINRYCDADDIVSVTHLVNGGLNGINSRKAYLSKAKALLAPLLASGAEPPGGGQPVLHLGSSGDAVANLQRRLSSLGYPTACDGDFGAATELAVKHYQSLSGLTADGIVAAQTWAKLQGAPA